MDIAALSEGMALASAAMKLIQQGINLIPDKQKKEEAQVSLAEAEKQMKIAEATIANELGYQICHNHFPPGIMISQDGANWECQECHSTKNTQKRLRLSGAKWVE